MALRYLLGLVAVGLMLLGGCGSDQPAPPPPPDPGTALVDLAQVAPTIIADIRYAGAHNFVGAPVPGYHAAKCLLTRPAAEGLARVQADLRGVSLGLKVYDCYRPQRAVDAFVAWAKSADTRMRAEFYPNVAMDRLFAEGYIAEKSGHSRGSTMDLTIVRLPAPPTSAYRLGQPLEDCRLSARERSADNGLDMGTSFDCFDPLAHTANPALGPRQRDNRALLTQTMAKHGFVNYDKEWWHFTLTPEPYPDTYFDSEIR